REHTLDRRVARMVGIPSVPEERERAARAQDTTDLAKRFREPEPVEGLRHGDGVDRSVLARDGLRGPGEHLDARDGPLELGAHPVDRLDRDHARPRGYEEPRQLPSAGAEIEDRPPRSQAEPLDEVLDRLGCVARSEALVACGAGSERGGRNGVKAQYAPRRARPAGIVLARISMSSQIDQFSR